METTIQSSIASGSVHSELTKVTSAFTAFLNSLEEARFAVAPMLLVVMVCLGGIAAAFAAQISQLQLMAVSLTTVAIEVVVIALVPMRTIFWFTVIALLVDLFVFIF